VRAVVAVVGLEPRASGRRLAGARQAFQRFNSDLLVAAVLARAGLGDSARHVVERSRGTPEIDATRDLAQFAAFVEVLLGEKEAAMRDLTTYLTASPGLPESFAANPGWWFDDLKDLPAYRRVVPAPK